MSLLGDCVLYGQRAAVVHGLIACCCLRRCGAMASCSTCDRRARVVCLLLVYVAAGRLRRALRPALCPTVVYKWSTATRGARRARVSCRFSEELCEIAGGWAPTTTLSKWYLHKTASELAELMSLKLLELNPGERHC